MTEVFPDIPFPELPFKREHWTPDEYRYIHAAAGVRMPRPFNLRWFIPFLCKNESHWLSINIWALIAIAGGVIGLGNHMGLSGWQTLAAAAMTISLPGMRFGFTHYLVDLPALGFATLAAASYVGGLWWLAIPLVLMSGASKESGPIFAALFAWSPVLLVGMIIPLIFYFVRKPGPDIMPNPTHQWILEHPFKAGIKWHASPLSPFYVVPWGAVLVGLTHPSWQLVAVLIVAYAQLFVATDTVRLYQWAAPIFTLAAVQAVPTAWLIVIVIATVWNPLQGDGI